MSKKHRVIEMLKNLLIVALIASSVWLMGESRVFQLSGLVGGSQRNDGLFDSEQRQSRLAQPMHMAVIGSNGCFGVQYSARELDETFEGVAPLLNEALSSAEQPRPMSSEDWERALVRAPGVYFDFQGGIPMSVLSAWLCGQEKPGLTANVRHLLLTADGEEVQLAYRDEIDGRYFSCPTQLVNLSHLRSAVDKIVPNGAVFACQAANYQVLAPHTILDAQTPRLWEYAAANPLPPGDREGLNRLLEDLSFPLGITTIYETPDGLRARSGNDTLSVSNDGVVTYYSTRDEERYPVAAGEGGSALLAAVDGAFGLVRGVLESRCADAELYLEQVEAVDRESWRMHFRYALNDTPVQVGQRGYAATVLVEDGYVTEFELQMRAYTLLEREALILPQEQAVAALRQLDREGRRLQLRYQDSGELVRPGWIAEGE